MPLYRPPLPLADDRAEIPLAPVVLLSSANRMERSESGGGLRPEESVAEMSWIRSTPSPKLL